jgi:hypothetical protein
MRPAVEKRGRWIEKLRVGGRRTARERERERERDNLWREEGMEGNRERERYEI